MEHIWQQLDGKKICFYKHFSAQTFPLDKMKKENNFILSFPASLTSIVSSLINSILGSSHRTAFPNDSFDFLKKIRSF